MLKPSRQNPWHKGGGRPISSANWWRWGERSAADDRADVDGSGVGGGPGPAALADRSTRRFGPHRHDPKTVDGVWQQLKAITPAGDEAKVWFDADKSGKLMKGEAALRRVLRAFKAVLPAGRKACANIVELSMRASRKPLARVVMGETSGESRYQWNLVAMRKHCWRAHGNREQGRSQCSEKRPEELLSLCVCE